MLSYGVVPSAEPYGNSHILLPQPFGTLVGLRFALVDRSENARGRAVVNRKHFLCATAFAASLSMTIPALAGDETVAQQHGPVQQEDRQPRRCHWWQFGRCNPDEPEIEGLPDGAPRTGTVITVDVSTNNAYLFQDGQLLARSPAATGSNRSLVHGDDEWLFRTPTGHMKVLRKVIDPVWRKPDWAFIEAGDRVPPPDSPKRNVRGHLGRYALDLGDGIMIHGTDEPGSIGRRVSHGCIRLPNAMLRTVFKKAKVGTDVFVFESQEPVETTVR
jgi:L,D-transpeptidase catalytic domain